MGIGPAYREFPTLDEYREFFRECQDADVNSVSMYLPDPETGRRVLGRVLITDPGHDHNLVKALLNEFADVKYKIAPVLLTEERRTTTDRLNHRVRLRKHLVVEYRRDMKNGAWFPLLVFVADKEYWASGRHRSEAAEAKYDAVYALVVEGLTESQILFISDTTNQWHSEKWDGDEAANLAYSYHKIDGLSAGAALIKQGLEPKHKDLFQAVQLWRRYPDINMTGGMGHPIYFPALTRIVLPYTGHYTGEDVTGGLTRAQWADIVWDRTGTTKKISTAYSGGERYTYVLESDRRKQWMLEGETIKEKYECFLRYKARVVTDAAATKGGVKEPTDDLRWIAFVKMFKDLDNAALTDIQTRLDTEWQEESRKLLFRLNLVFGE